MDGLPKDIADEIEIIELAIKNWVEAKKAVLYRLKQLKVEYPKVDNIEQLLLEEVNSKKDLNSNTLKEVKKILQKIIKTESFDYFFFLLHFLFLESQNLFFILLICLSESFSSKTKLSSASS